MSAVLGVDLASMRIAVTCVSSTGSTPTSRDWRWERDLAALNGGQRLVAFRRRVRLEVLPTLPLRPLAIGIEDPKYRQYSRILQASFGVVWELLSERYSCPILDMSAKEPKRSVCGSGNANKADAMKASLLAGGGTDWTEDQHDAHLVALHTLALCKDIR